MGQTVVSAERRLSVFTVGHSNVPLADFVALLGRHAVEVVVDVRSAPYSRYVPHFNRPALEPALRAAGIEYQYLGQELGGRPADRGFYDADGHVRYDAIAATPRFLDGIERVLAGLLKRRVALMCNEENPAECHRRLLVGRVLAGRGVTVQHIRGDGRVQPESELAGVGSEPAAGQLNLEFVAREKPEWKSTRSASPARPRPSSSDS